MNETTTCDSCGKPESEHREYPTTNGTAYACPKDDEVCTSEQMQNALVALLQDAGDVELYPWLENAQIQTYADGGYLTRDAGMVVQLDNGERFQITIARY
jgi:hypothetical protein